MTIKFRHYSLPIIPLLFIACCIYGSIINHQFLINWDDNVYVTDNESIRGFTFEHLKQAFTTFYVGNYAPVQIISYMIDYALWGAWAGGFLLTNLILHTTNSVIYYLLHIYYHGRRLWAFIASAFFLCHPVQVESVAWISQRKNVLSMFFFLLAFLSYILFQKKYRQKGTLFYTASLLAFILAILTKSVAVVLPAILLTSTIFFANRAELRKNLINILPYWAIAIGGSAIALVSQNPAKGGGRAGYWGGSLINTTLSMPPVLARYLGMLVWPSRLSAAYDQTYKEGVDAQVMLSSFLLIGLVCVAIYLYRKQRLLCFWLVVFFIGLAPVSQIVPLVTLMNDRYLYFPILGFAGLFGGLIVLVTERLQRQWSTVAKVCAGIVILALSLAAHLKVQAWENAETLWRDAVKNQPNASMAWLGLGHALLSQERFTEAMNALLRSYEIFPQDEDTLANLGYACNRLQKPLFGRRYLLQLISINPRHHMGLLLLGENFLLTNEPLAAERFYKQALQLDPQSIDLLTVLGDISTETGRLDQAAELYLKALIAGADPSRVEYLLARVAAKAGQTDEALKHLEISFQKGFKDYSRLKKDQAFDVLRNGLSFSALITKYAGQN